MAYAVLARGVAWVPRGEVSVVVQCKHVGDGCAVVAGLPASAGAEVALREPLYKGYGEFRVELTQPAAVDTEVDWVAFTVVA